MPIIVYKRIMKKEIFFAAIVLFILNSFFVFPLDRKLTIGRADSWNYLSCFKNLELRPGRENYLDVALKDNEYTADEKTDLLLHFNKSEVSKYYQIISSGISFSEKLTALGNSAGVFNKKGLVLRPEPGALFYPGTSWNDFTMEFWLYPAILADGEIVFRWIGTEKIGGKRIYQEIKCSISNRRLVWRFDNIFLRPGSGRYSIELTGRTSLIPKKWHHHLIRYNSSIGMLEYLIDNKPEAVKYTSETENEDNSIFLPYIGRDLPGNLNIGSNFLGLIDEFRILRQFLSNPVIKKLKLESGTLITKPIDLGYTNSEVFEIEATDRIAGGSDIFYYYFISDKRVNLIEDDSRWIQFKPGGRFLSPVKGRYLYLMARFFSDGMGTVTPLLSEFNISWIPDYPPASPAEVTAVPGDGEITLNWSPVSEFDVRGYLIYYGESPGDYSKGRLKMKSPVDVGKVTSFTISGLKNGKLYFFSIVSYDSSSPPHESRFSKEVSARPANLFR